ncbi:helix-turn-helix domain-containing protein [Devosia algicola]|uniref:Helix-turn-helix domain-containing protein n=1 Tax=Devosia algicola TaxID=3026418 RepID=A0ABY7YPH1_9HYPH|nr:helix-turn-helix domain-containing protein [Devosia algicola]WDR03087.1 helix-turn-helix domain-containing protein [Devosia algicola]
MPLEQAASEIASPWLDTAAAALHLGREPGTLRGWRSVGKGPAFHLVSGRFVRYHIDDLEAFEGRQPAKKLSADDAASR